MVKTGERLMVNKSNKITVDNEFLEVLKILEDKVKHATWDGMDKVSYKTLTRILARKIKSSKLVS